MAESLDISRQLILITSTNIPGWRNIKVILFFLFPTRHLSSRALGVTNAYNVLCGFCADVK